MIDIAIIGGGISGLWTLHTLRRLGFDAHLFEQTALGHGQTIASQGIIHGGMKYALNGFAKSQSNTLSNMPNRWRSCLEGCGELDLRKVTVLQNNQTLKFSNSLFGMFVAGLMSSKVTSIGGGKYELDEPVLDVKSLLTTLQQQHADYIYLGKPVEHRLAVHTAGIGNEQITTSTQRRPLRMIMVKGAPYMEYTHVVGYKSKPLATVTSHLLGNEIVWYIGGQIAEDAVNQSSPLEFAKKRLMAVVGDIDWSNKDWAYHDVVRAEPSNEFELPSHPVVISTGHDLVAWPTKLAFAPELAGEIANLVWMRGFHKKHHAPLNLPRPQVAAYPWESAKWTRL